MEESKDLQTLYKVFRFSIYIALGMEFFEYAIDPSLLDFWGGIVANIHDRIKFFGVYQDGHLLRSKVMILIMICVTCVGTRNKKQLEFNAMQMVVIPITIGLLLMFLSVWVFYQQWSPKLWYFHFSTWLYFVILLSAKQYYIAPNPLNNKGWEFVCLCISPLMVNHRISEALRQALEALF